MLDKRTLLAGGLVAAMGAGLAAAAVPPAALGQIAKITAKPGEAAALRAAFAEHTRDWTRMPDCLGYFVCEDAKAEGVFWVVELWADPQAHDRATATAEGRAAMADNRPHIAHFELLGTFNPVAGALRSTL